MFSKACAQAREWTRPLVVSVRYADGSTEAFVGTYFLVTKEGWALTAGHLFDTFVKFQKDQEKKKEAEGMDPSRVVTDPKWITNHSFWFGDDTIRLSKVIVNRKIDMAIMKLENVRGVNSLPVFRSAETIAPGTSLCRMGFPFSNLKTEFNAESKNFSLSKNSIPIPFFPNECMHTRNISMGREPEGLDVLYLETSTPGYKGQSGGPVFDAEGRVCGMQVRNNYIALGKPPEMSVMGGENPMQEYASLGVAVHSQTLVQFLKMNNVAVIVKGPVNGPRISAQPPTAKQPDTVMDKSEDGSTYIIN